MSLFLVSAVVCCASASAAQAMDWTLGDCGDMCTAERERDEPDFDTAFLLQFGPGQSPAEKISATKEKAESAETTVQAQCRPSCSHSTFTLLVRSQSFGTRSFEMVRNEGLVTHDFHVATPQGDGVTTLRSQLPREALACHYQGTGAVLSTCHGLHGILRIDDQDFELEQINDGNLLLRDMGASLSLGGSRNMSENSTPVATMQYDVQRPSAVCGNGIVERGEHCDSGPCCTKACRFAGARVMCHNQLGECGGAGYCSGDSDVCEIRDVRAGVHCAHGGMCFEGRCVSRDTQCKNSGYVRSCDDDSCHELYCLKPDGSCVPAGIDLALEDGTPCEFGQCFLGQCLESELLLNDNTAYAEVLPPVASSVVAAADELLEVPICLVLTKRAYAHGYDEAKILNLVNFLDAVYRVNSKIQVKITLKQLYIDTSAETNDLHPTNADLGTFREWVRTKTNAGVISSDAAAVQLLAGPNSPSDCYGTVGLAYVGTLCYLGYGGISTVTANSGLCSYGGYYGSFPLVAHELGHNFGMPHLWTNSDLTRYSSGYIMDYGSVNQPPQFHPNSISSYNAKKGTFTCLKPYSGR